VGWGSAPLISARGSSLLGDVMKWGNNFDERNLVSRGHSCL